MRMAKPEPGHILLTIFGLSILTFVVHGQNEVGFISLDCGTTANSSYTDPDTGLSYVSDASFIDTGVIESIEAGNTGSSSPVRQLLNVRTFPTGDRNCYNIPVTVGTMYLTRTTFYYGNYDGLNKLPTFDLHLGVNQWVTVKILNATNTSTKEIIHIPTTDYMYVCLVNTGTGTPFVSALELRPLSNNSYVLPAVGIIQFT